MSPPLENPPCDRCPSFDTPKCERCIWRIEYELLKQYGSWDAVREQMYKEFMEAKQHRSKNIYMD